MRLNERIYKILIGPVVLLWISFTIIYILSLESTFPLLFNVNFVLIHLISWAFFLGHGLKRLGKPNVIIFFLIASSVSLIIELIWSATGILGGYYYTEIAGPKILGLVPFFVPITWFNLMYVTRMFTDFIFKGIILPHYRDHPILLGIFDSVALTALDLSIDPLSVSKSFYVWPKGGEYVGIPITNYLGWFIITFISFTAFRLFEKKSPSKNKIHDRILKDSVSSLYIFVNLISIIMVYSTGEYLPVMVSLIATAPFVLLWLFVILNEIGRMEWLRFRE